MTSSPAHLRVVDAQTGEIHDNCPHCSVKNDEIAGLERDIRGWAARYAELKREKDQQAREHEAWPLALKCFNGWRSLCRHPKARFTADRFWLWLPFYEQDGEELCDRAVRGAAFDPWKTRRRNGSEKRHDSWELIFRDRGKFEEFCNRAPREQAA